MANLTLKGIPDEILAKLKAEAKKQGRTVQEHVLALLAQQGIERWGADPFATQHGERSRRDPAFDEADVLHAQGREYDL